MRFIDAPLKLGWRGNRGTDWKLGTLIGEFCFVPAEMNASPNRQPHSSNVSRTRRVISTDGSLGANCTTRSKPCGPVIKTRMPPRKGSAAIQASYGADSWLPPASTAASIRSRCVAGRPSVLKTVSGIANDCSPRERSNGASRRCSPGVPPFGSSLSRRARLA